MKIAIKGRLQKKEKKGDIFLWSDQIIDIVNQKHD